MRGKFKPELKPEAVPEGMTVTILDDRIDPEHGRQFKVDREWYDIGSFESLEDEDQYPGYCHHECHVVVTHDYKEYINLEEETITKIRVCQGCGYIDVDVDHYDDDIEGL